MPSMELLVAFFVATMLFAYMPGPAMLYTAAQTVARGRRAGFMAALGIHGGGYVHVIGAAVGLSALLAAVPTLYAVIKFAGAMYLIWLGIQLWRQSSDHRMEHPIIESKSGRRAFLDSIAVEVLNPKTAMFFIAFLPQFADASAAFPIWVQMLILGTFVNIAFSSADIVCVILADAVVGRLKRSLGMQKMARRIGGTVLVGLGIHLAAQRS